MKTPVALLIDAVLVLVFVLVGRASHAEPLDPAGVLRTGWPFGVALLAGWQVARIWRGAAGIGRGAVVWLVCAGGGLLLRVAFTDQTARLPFVVVAFVTTGLFLVGWRALATLLLRGRARADGSAGRRTGGRAGARAG